MNTYVKKRCATCNGTGTMEAANANIIRERRQQYVDEVPGDTADVVLRKVRYILGTKECEDVVERAKEIVKRVGRKRVMDLVLPVAE